MSISYNDRSKIFKIDTQSTSYLIKIGEFGHVFHVYYGKTVSDDALDDKYIVPECEVSFSPRIAEYDDNRYSLDIMSLEYPCGGISDFRPSAISVIDEGGGRSCDIRYKAHEIFAGKKPLPGLPTTHSVYEDECRSLEIICTDSILDLEVVLSYTMFEGKDAIAKSARMTSGSDKPIVLSRALSGILDFKTADFDILTLHGGHNKERHLQRHSLQLGSYSISSIRGASSHQQNPFMILCDKNATEDTGSAFGFNLVYSGNFIAEVHANHVNHTRFIMGINPSDFNWKLKKGEVFQTPEMIMVYSGEGFAGLSHTYHNLYRDNLIRGKYKDIARPVLINNYEATYFDFDGKRLRNIAKIAAELGIELFVLDDGWFGNRENDRSSLGDWFVNEDKLGVSMGGLAKEINKLGMKFGLWIEPEMVSQDSNLYRQNPSWALQVKNRKSSEGRQQLVLDMSRDDVLDYLYDAISTVLRNANIEYLKWDMNRHLTEVCSSFSTKENSGELYHRYTLGVYKLMDRITTDFPNILLENCSGGGGRFDPGMLYYSPQIWASDNTDAIERLKIQYGTSFAYPISSMGSHVSICPNHQTGRVTPLGTRATVALSGTFGYELDLEALSQVEKDQIKAQIEVFHKNNELISRGNYYRLSSPITDRFTAWQFVSIDKKHILLQFVQTDVKLNETNFFVKLKGLLETAKYKNVETGEIHFGNTLMNIGVVIPYFHEEYTSFNCRFELIEQTITTE